MLVVVLVTLLVLLSVATSLFVVRHFRREAASASRLYAGVFTGLNDPRPGAEASALLRHALEVDPWTGRAHERLGMIALANGDPREAIREFERERAASPPHAGLALRVGQAWRRLGNDRRAREWYGRELSLDPSSQEAADSLRALDR